MKTRRTTFTASALALALALTACGDADDADTTDDVNDEEVDGDDAEDETADDDDADENGDENGEEDGDDAAADGDLSLTLGVSPVPHGDIVTYIQDELADDAGLEIEVIEFTDYIQPNVALHEGDLDANYFQHLPYLEQQMEDEPDYDFTPLSPVHIEPLALYAPGHGGIDDLPEDGQIAVPNDPANLGRAMWLLEDAGIITVADTGDELPTELDVDENELGLTFNPVEAASLPSVLPDVDAAVINGNYALEADLSPADDGLAIEEAEDNPYANRLVARDENAEDEAVAALDDLLTSDEVRDWIENEYADGTVIPAE